jgi:stress responsive alpha/beta barrel protein
MIKHCVFSKIRADVAPGERDEVLAGFGELVGEVPGMSDFAWGPNRDYENKTGDYSFGFVVSFSDRAAHLAYESHPEHVALGARLVAMCVGGYEGITVFDLEV